MSRTGPRSSTRRRTSSGGRWTWRTRRTDESALPPPEVAAATPKVAEPGGERNARRAAGQRPLGRREMTGLRFLAAGLVGLAAGAAEAGTLKCPADSVKVGNVCVDRYEVSVWQIPTSNVGLIKRVQAGKATLADLTGGGATQLT